MRYAPSRSWWYLSATPPEKRKRNSSQRSSARIRRHRLARARPVLAAGGQWRTGATASAGQTRTCAWVVVAR